MKRSREKLERHVVWLIGFLLFASFVLADAGIVVWCARLASAGEILAYAFTFVLLSSGTLFTLWQMER